MVRTLLVNYLVNSVHGLLPITLMMMHRHCMLIMLPLLASMYSYYFFILWIEDNAVGWGAERLTEVKIDRGQNPDGSPFGSLTKQLTEPFCGKDVKIRDPMPAKTGF